MVASPRPVYASWFPTLGGAQACRGSLSLIDYPFSIESGVRTGRRGSAPCCRTAATAPPRVLEQLQRGRAIHSPTGQCTASLGDPQPLWAIHILPWAIHSPSGQHTAPPGDPELPWQSTAPVGNPQPPWANHSLPGRSTAPAGNPQPPLGDPQLLRAIHSSRTETFFIAFK